MKPVSDVKAAPYRWVCSIIVTFPSRVRMPIEERVTGPSISGTGLLVSPRYVLTCGHILRGLLLGSPFVTPTRITVIPGRRPGDSAANRAPFGEWEASPENCWVHPNLLNSTKALAASFDFGLLKLEPKNGGYPGDIRLPNNELFGWWGAAESERTRMFADSSDHGLAQRKINIAGYPYRNVDPDRMYSGFDAVDGTFPRDPQSGRIQPLLLHRFGHSPGVSGGALWTRDDNPTRRLLVALHAGTRDGDGYALLIRPPLISLMQEHGLSPTRLRVF